MKKIFFGRIKNKQLMVLAKKEFADFIQKAEGVWFEIRLSTSKKRTKKQNNALHLYFSQLAEALNDAGLDQKKVLKPEVDIPWDMEDVKEKIWRPIQELALKKKSTKQLNSQSDINKVYDILNRHLSEKFPGFPNIPFPFECSSCGGLSKHYKDCPEY